MTDREKDRFLALNLMGWEFQQNAPEGYFCTSVGNDQGWWLAPGDKQWSCEKCYDLPPRYSTDISLALGDGGPDTVAGAMKSKGMQVLFFREEIGKWTASFNYNGQPKPMFRASADTPAAAICDAAILALNGDKP